MNRSVAWLTHTANLLAGGTGVVYAIMRYALRPADEFAVVNHPWQSHVQHAHVLLSPLLVLVIGHLLIAHATYHWRRGTREGRRSGLILAVCALPMVFSGYAIQVSVSEGWRGFWVGVHLVFSAAWLGAYLAHWVAHRRISSGRTPGRYGE